MEVLLFALFFIVTLLFFISGKDDFGRKDNKLISDKSLDTKNETKIEPKEEVQKEVE